jgi:hypothetical protein
MPKPMTAAEYAAHAEAVNSQQPTEIVTLKSGSVFELKRPDLQRLVVLGLVPQSLLNEGLKAWQESGIKKKGNKAKVVVDFGTAQRTLVIAREIVADACVTPPFNEVTAKSFLKQDFNEIYRWAMGIKEGPATEGLKSFRKGRKRRAVTNRSDSKELQPDTVSDAAN